MKHFLDVIQGICESGTTNGRCAGGLMTGRGGSVDAVHLLQTVGDKGVR